MMKWFNFPTGLWIGATSILMICAALDSPIAPILDPDDPTRFWAVVGGFFAALCAVVAALISVDHQERIRVRERQQRLNAARAVLPLTLSRISKLSRDAYFIALDAETIRQDEQETSQALIRLEISDEDLSVIKDCIELADTITGVWLSLIPAHYQFLRSRLERDLTENGLIVGGDHSANAAIDWLELKAFCDQLFDFGRTGRKASEALDVALLRLPIERAHLPGTEDRLKNELTRHKNYIEQNGGYSAFSYRNRLM